MGSNATSGERPQTNFAEAGEVGGVSRMVERVRSGAKNVSAESAIGVFEHARSPMAGGRARDLNPGVAKGVPGLGCFHAGKSKVVDEIVYADGHDGDGCALILALLLAHDFAQ